MRVYTAASYKMMGHVREEVWPLLQSDGHTMTARWVQGLESSGRQEAALMDVEDIDKSDCLMLFTNPRGTLATGGGRHWEFGYAFGRWRFDKRNTPGLYYQMKRIVVVGDHEHVFCHLPMVEVFGTLAMARGALRSAERVGAP